MAQSDLEFLGALVQRGRMDADQARAIAAEVAGGARLEPLLCAALEIDAEELHELRRGGGVQLPKIPGYRVDGLLGEGGTARVYSARSVKTLQPVALKVLEPASMAQAATAEGFVAEIKLLKRLQHRHIVRAFGAARWSGTLIGVLELVRGENLGERLAEGRPLEEQEALRVVLEIAEALEHLSAVGIVHRDVKPANVMLEAGGRAVLIDLGFATEASADPGADGGVEGAAETVAGTAAYLAPERARGSAGDDARSDVYALGATLFHLVVGKLPFEASDDADVLEQQIFQSLTSPELKGRGLSPHLHYFIEKMMAKDAGDRFQSFAELIADVRGHLDGRQAMERPRGQAAPPSGSLRGLRKRRRKG